VPRYLTLICLSTLAALVWPLTSSAYAHGFGDKYQLPIPLWLYIIGAGSAVALSFAVVGIFVQGAPAARGYPRLNLLRSPVARALAHPLVLGIVKVFSVLLFILVVLAGLIGDQSPVVNIAPTFVWIIWWIGLAYVCAFLGDLWALLNPWKALFSWAEALYRRLDPEGELSFRFSYPQRLGVWPGIAGFAFFAWLEIVFIGGSQPWTIAALALLYWVFTFTGMLLFGKHIWLRNGEAFTLFFGFLARCAITEVRVVDPEVCARCSNTCRIEGADCIGCHECMERARGGQREWNLRPLGAGLLARESVTVSQTAFVLMMLSTVTFDGLKETSAWGAVSIPVLRIIRNTYLVGAMGLLSFPLLFASTYLLFCKLIVVFSGSHRSLSDVARSFVYSLIPIAVAYHLAHYFSYILVQGQFIIPLMSDPFGYGWNLFGTADYLINIAFASAQLAWFAAVFAIVGGHVLAVLIAHLLAMRVFPDHAAALRSQYPMLILMVGYTMFSLWIIAQPIIATSG